MTDELHQIINKHKLEDHITLKGHPNWKLMLFKDQNKMFSDGFKTLIFQELIKHGIFFRGTFNPTISHTELDVEATLSAFDKALKVYQDALNSSNGYLDFLVGDPVKPVFRKWN